MHYEYTEYGNLTESQILSTMLPVILVTLALSLVIYIFESLGFYTMAKRRGIHYPGLAWVPIARDWLMGSLADQYAQHEGQRKSYRKVLPVLNACFVISFGIAIGLVINLVIRIEMNDPALMSPAMMAGSVEAFVMQVMGPSIALLMVGYILAIIYIVFFYIALYKIYKSARPQSATVFTVLSILIGITRPFFVYACRNDDLGFVQPVYYGGYGMPYGGQGYPPQQGYPSAGNPYQGQNYTQPYGTQPPYGTQQPPYGGYQPPQAPYTPPQQAAPYTPPTQPQDSYNDPYNDNGTH